MDWTGIMTTGWQYIGGHWYYMNADGIMVTGRHYINKRWYYFNANGVWN